METKEIKIKNYDVLFKKVDELMKDNKTFFVNGFTIIVLESGTFLEFYLFIFKEIYRDKYSEIGIDSTNFYLYVSKRLKNAFKRSEIITFQNYLGKNFDSYKKYTTDIFVMY